MWGSFAAQQFAPESAKAPLGLHGQHSFPPRPLTEAQSLSASRGCTRCHATLHFCRKFPKLFPQLRVQQLICSFTDMHSTWPTHANFSAHCIRCELHALQLQEPLAYMKTQLAFLYFK